MDVEKFVKRLGISNKELAERLGISLPNISIWKSGKAVPSYQVCRDLLRIGMRVDELFDEETLEAIKTSHRKDFTLDSLTPDECVEIVRKGLAGLREKDFQK